MRLFSFVDKRRCGLRGWNFRSYYLDNEGASSEKFGARVAQQASEENEASGNGAGNYHVLLHICAFLGRHELSVFPPQQACGFRELGNCYPTWCHLQLLVQ